ncbi:FAD-linked sulfhydryl oxidase ERV1 [Asparagus officinalis]|uniref:FAD-linked sulfhydryl oxidase ERV1 n=1 Tax=Asparagus officinalis TaxID=4686 RepID=UPI00098DF0EA|nr:FAD-linked sulfhydryl oxidase ERV1 [Asparagus officinalis]
MSENPFEFMFKSLDSFSRCAQTHISNFLSPLQNKPSLKDKSALLKSVDVSLASTSFTKEKSATPLTKEELGRGTWALLHAIAAQYPDQPTRQQKRDAKELMAILSRLYPCKECADHFKDVLKANPVHAGSQAEFSQWLCHVHNVVNRSLGKLTFPCQRVNARWGKLDCKDRACDLQGTPDLK